MKKRNSNTSLQGHKVRRACLILISCAAGVAAIAPMGFAHAQTYPFKPITMVVPFPPGGPTDQVARVLAQKLSEQMGQSVVVDNKPGANGNIGGAYVSKATADGYTLLYNTSSITLSPALYKTLTYDVQKDLAPVALTAVVPMALVVHPSIPANTYASLWTMPRPTPTNCHTAQQATVM